MQESLEASFMWIRTVTGLVVGASFLVGERRLLPCTHVVSQALQLADPAGDPPLGEGWLDFPLTASERRFTASVVLWPTEAGRAGR